MRGWLDNGEAAPWSSLGQSALGTKPLAEVTSPGPCTCDSSAYLLLHFLKRIILGAGGPAGMSPTSAPVFGPNGASRPASETTPNTPSSFRLWTIFSAVCLWEQLLYVVGIMSLTSHQLPDPMALPCQGKITASCLVRACGSLLHQPSLNPDIYPEAVALEKAGGHAYPLPPCRQLAKRSGVMPWSCEAPGHPGPVKHLQQSSGSAHTDSIARTSWRTTS